MINQRGVGSSFASSFSMQHAAPQTNIGQIATRPNSRLMVCKEAVMIETRIAELPIGLTHPAFIIAALWPVIAGTIGRSQGRTA